MKTVVQIGCVLWIIDVLAKMKDRKEFRDRVLGYIAYGLALLTIIVAEQVL